MCHILISSVSTILHNSQREFYKYSFNTPLVFIIFRFIVRFMNNGHKFSLPLSSKRIILFIRVSFNLNSTWNFPIHPKVVHFQIRPLMNLFLIEGSVVSSSLHQINSFFYVRSHKGHILDYLSIIDFKIFHNFQIQIN